MLPESNERPAESVAVNLALYEPLRQTDVSMETVCQEVELSEDDESSPPVAHALVLIRRHQSVIEVAPG